MNGAHRQVLKGTYETFISQPLRVIELVHKVGLEREQLAVDAIFRRRVPVHLIRRERERSRFLLCMN